MLVTEASEIPDEQYHTVTVEADDDGTYAVSASNNGTHCVANVGSVALSGQGSVGLNEGSFTLNAADAVMRLTYLDFTDQHGYDEIDIKLEKRD